LAFLKVPEFYKGKKVLLLQGPRGPFFWRLKKDLESFGAKVYKINFNGGDFIFYPKDCTNFRGSIEEWREFLREFLRKNKIDLVLLFSDWRPIHKIAIEVCKEEGVLVGVFEEGYVRPNFSTLEPVGVNGYSLISKGNLNLEKLKVPSTFPKEELHIGNPFWREFLWAIIYYFFANLLRPMFPKYKHHISLYFPESLFKEGIPWIKSGIRKYYYLYKERHIKKFIFNELPGKYFLVPLQVHNDSQVVIHSPFKDVKEFIELVIRSFSKHAPEETYLVFKHHPRDRGYRDYTRFIGNLSNSYGVEDRIFYIHDAHLPTLIDNSIGVVVINSSVGLQALVHYKPTIVLGKAIYKQEGLVYSGSLDNFWKDAKTFRMNRKVFNKFINFLKFYCQINGSLHKRVSKESHTGLVWECHNLEEINLLLQEVYLKIKEDFSV